MISLFKKKEAPVYPADTVTSRDGRPIVFTFFKHASLAVDFDGGASMSIRSASMPITRICRKPMRCSSPIRITTISTVRPSSN